MPTTLGQLAMDFAQTKRNKWTAIDERTYREWRQLKRMNPGQLIIIRVDGHDEAWGQNDRRALCSVKPDLPRKPKVFGEAGVEDWYYIPFCRLADGDMLPAFREHFDVVLYELDLDTGELLRCEDQSGHWYPWGRPEEGDRHANST